MTHSTENIINLKNGDLIRGYRVAAIILPGSFLASLERKSGKPLLHSLPEITENKRKRPVEGDKLTEGKKLSAEQRYVV